MNRHFIVAPCVAAVLILGLVSCSRDPNIRKQKYLESGNRYFEKGKYREAAIQYANALQVDPRFAEAHYRMAQADISLSLWAEGYKELQRAVDLQPDNLKAQLDLGNMHIAAKEYQLAQTSADEILRRDPGNADVHLLLANLASAKGETSEAFAEVRKAIAIDPRQPQYYVTLGIFLASGNQLSDAEANFKKALELNPKLEQAEELLGKLEVSQQRWADAEHQFRTLIEQSPKNVSARQDLADLYFAQNRKADAEKVLSQAANELADDPVGYRLLADFYLDSGDADRASQEFAKLCKAHPKDLKLKSDYARVLLFRKKIEEATQLDNEILKANPKQTEALIIRGELLNAQQKYAEAISSLHEALKYEPDDAQANYQLGVALSATGDINGAQQHWATAVQEAPEMNEAQLALAQLAIRKGDTELLMETAEQLIKNIPTDPQGYVFRALAESQRKAEAAAEADLRKAIEVAPEMAIGYAQLGNWQIHQKKFADAEKLYEQALAKDANAIDALRGLASLYTLEGKPQVAIQRVHAQLEKTPKNSDYHLLLATLQFQSRDWAGARDSARQTLDLDPNNMDAFLLIGQSEIAVGSPDQALADTKTWMMKAPDDVRPYVLAGSLEESQGNWNDAQQLYRKALDLQPDYAPAANNLAYSLLEHSGNTDLALSLAQTAYRGLPNLPSVADTLAWAYYHKGTYGAAADLLEQALTSQPNDATLHYHLGLVYERKNDLAKARRHLKKALEISPNGRDSDQIRKALDSLS